MCMYSANLLLISTKKTTQTANFKRAQQHLYTNTHNAWTLVKENARHNTNNMCVDSFNISYVHNFYKFIPTCQIIVFAGAAAASIAACICGRSREYLTLLLLVLIRFHLSYMIIYTWKNLFFSLFFLCKYTSSTGKRQLIQYIHISIYIYINFEKEKRFIVKYNDTVNALAHTQIDLEIPVFFGSMVQFSLCIYTYFNISFCGQSKFSFFSFFISFVLQQNSVFLSLSFFANNEQCTHTHSVCARMWQYASRQEYLQKKDSCL